MNFESRVADVLGEIRKKLDQLDENPNVPTSEYFEFLDNLAAKIEDAFAQIM